MYSEGFAESEPPESWRDKVLEAWRIPPLWSTQMRSDTYKHLEDCTLLRVNAQTAREGPYRHRISIEEADDVWAATSPTSDVGGSSRPSTSSLAAALSCSCVENSMCSRPR